MNSEIYPALSSPAGGATAVSAEMLAAVARLVQLYEQLTPQHLDSLHLCYAAQAHFKDPFNDVRGVASIRQVFAHMFDTLDAPRFAVTEQLVQGQQAFLAWEFHFRLRRWRAGQPHASAAAACCASTHKGWSKNTVITGILPRNCTKSCLCWAC